jgi:hypothetical protein
VDIAGEYQDPSIEEGSIKSFEIEREDDLTEMVWALQNAGKALMLQEDLKKESMNRALRYEIEAFKEVLSQISDGIRFPECFPTVAIEGFLRTPPERNDNLITTLYTLYRYARAINHIIRVGGRDIDEERLDEVRKTLDELDKILKE